MNQKPKPSADSTIWILLVITLAAFGLRYYGSWIRFFWYDELAVHVYAMAGYPSSHEPPLFSWLEFIWIWLTGSDSPATMRILPVAFGALAVPVTYRFALLFGSRRSALLAAVLIAISPKALQLSHEIRPYSLFMLTSAILIGTYFSALQKNSRKAWLIYGVSLMVCLWSHLVAVQLCVALGLAALAGACPPWSDAGGPSERWIRVRNLALISALFGLLGILWFALFRTRPLAVFEGMYPHGPRQFCETLLPGFLSHWAPPADRKSRYLAAGLLISAFTALGWLALLVSHRKKAGFLAILAVCVVGINYLTMGRMASWGYPWTRYFSALLIPTVTLVAIGATWLGEKVLQAAPGIPRPMSLLPAALALALFLPGTRSWFVHVNHSGHGSGGQYVAWGDYTDAHAAELEGAIILPHSHSIGGNAPRERHAFHLTKTNDLPVYVLTKGELLEVGLTPSRGGITQVPSALTPIDAPPPDGRYAVLSVKKLKRPEEMRFWTKRITRCRKIGRHLRTIALCDVEFSRSPETGSEGTTSR